MPSTSRQADDVSTFGRAISKFRKEKGWSQKELAARIIREDGDAISPQYLNDIEHDRRSPTSDHIVRQFASVLEVEAEWLYYLAGRFPDYVRERKYTREELNELMVAFRSPAPKSNRS